MSAFVKFWKFVVSFATETEASKSAVFAEIIVKAKKKS